MARHIGVRRAMRPSATDSISVCSIQRATLDAGVGIVTQHHDCALALVREQPRDIVCIPVGPRGAEEVGAESWRSFPSLKFGVVEFWQTSEWGSVPHQ